MRFIVTALVVAAVFNLTCGLPPLPPLGCSRAVCVCDEDGNCSWSFVCR
jgi:hypothetical protein